MSIKNKKTRRALPSVLAMCLVAAAVGMAGCDLPEDQEGAGDDVPQTQVARHALVKMDTCEDFGSYARKAAIERMRLYVGDVDSFSERCSTEVTYISASADVEDFDFVVDTDEASNNAAMSVDADADADDESWDVGAESVGEQSKGALDVDSRNDGDSLAGSYTETNVQELGVDEADIVKTDGNYIYSLSGDALAILAMEPEGALSSMGRIELGGWASELFLYKDLAVVVSSIGGDLIPQEIRRQTPSWRTDAVQDERTDSVNYAVPDTDSSMPEPDSWTSDTDSSMPDTDFWMSDTDSSMPTDTDESSADGGVSMPTDTDESSADGGVSMPTDTDDSSPDAGAGMPEQNYFYAEAGYMRLSIVDISDRAAPRLIRKIDYAGDYVSARRVGNALRLVLSSPVPALDVQTDIPWWSFCEMAPEVGKQVYEAYATALIEANTKLIESVSSDEIIPKKMDTVGDSSTVSPMVGCGELYGPNTPAGIGLLTVASIQLDDPTAVQTDIGIMGEEGLVYASQSALYLTTSSDYVQRAVSSGLWDETTSGIHKFDIASDPGRAVYKATGQVQGRMLDQFCLGEHNGFLRVATTTGSGSFTTWDNRLSIFEEKEGELEEVSHLEGFGKEEEIHGARFVGDRGFIVTFRQTDPLFTFDLSDPYNPKAVGAWEGPGYSTYLHPLGDNHIITVGLEDWRPHISLYDLTDLSKPTLVERYFMDGKGANEYFDGDLSSPAVYSHKAFTFDPERGLLALPYNMYAWSYIMEDDMEMEESRETHGIALYNVTTQDIAPLGKMSMDVNWSVDNSARTERSILTDDFVYAISRCRVTTAALDELQTTLDTEPLFQGDTCQERYYMGMKDSDEGWGWLKTDVDEVGIEWTEPEMDDDFTIGKDTDMDTGFDVEPGWGDWEADGGVAEADTEGAIAD